jgi:ADP-ribosylglycohydrolase
VAGCGIFFLPTYQMEMMECVSVTMSAGTLPKLRFPNGHLTSEFCPAQWRSAMESLRTLQCEGGTLCDPHIEWSFLAVADVAVRHEDWIGFSHTSFGGHFSTGSDASALFEDTVFLDSLKTCRGVFVFSSDFALAWQDALVKAGFPSIEVLALTYPAYSQKPGKVFSTGKFMANKNRKILQVGTRDRRLFGLAAVRPCHESIPLGECLSVRKACLTRAPLSAYLPRLHSAYEEVQASDEERSLVGGALDFSARAVACIMSVGHMVPADYQSLFVDNVIFLHVERPSLVTVLLEAYVRNCPVLVNRYPAAVEVLGSDYPLFFDDILMAEEVLTMENIRKAAAMLAARNKDMYDIRTFFSAVTESVIYRNLPLLSRAALESRTRGGYFGAIVGDQLPFAGLKGSSDEGTAANKRTGNVLRAGSCVPDAMPIYRWPPGAHRSEAEMALCSLRAFEPGRDFDPVDHMDRFVRWLTEGAETAVCCEATRRAIGRYLAQKLGNPLNKANPYQGLSRCPDDRLPADAAPLTRMFPLVLYCTSRPAAARRIVQSYVELTHGSLECTECAIVMVNIALGLFYGKRKDAVLSGEPTIEVQHLRLPGTGSLLVGDYMLKSPDALVARGSAVRVLECALWALWKSETFEGGMELVMSLDPAANEASSLYGFLAGILYGEASIPTRWRGSGLWLGDIMGKIVLRGWGVSS